MNKTPSTSVRQSTRERLTRFKRILLGFRSLLDEALQPRGITTSQLRLLSAIRDAPSLSGAALARRCSVTPQTGQTLLKRALANGWITREVSRSNHRVLTSQLTPAGEQLLRETERILEGIEQKLWRGATADQIEVLDRLLQLGCENIDRLQRPYGADPDR